MKNKRLKFRLHFNRINMQRGNPNVWTVHNCRGCFQTHKVILRVPVETIFKKDARQPRAYFSGYGYLNRFDNGIIEIL